MNSELMGSGERAISENEAALREAQQKLKELQSQDIDHVNPKELQDLMKHIERLKEDQGRINAGGM